MSGSGADKLYAHEIAIAGGSTRIPKVWAMIRKFVNGKEPHTSVIPNGCQQEKVLGGVILVGKGCDRWPLMAGVVGLSGDGP